MFFLIALLLAPPPSPAEAAFAIADTADVDRVQLLAEFAERWTKAPLGPKALAAAMSGAKTPADRIAVARAALAQARPDDALRMLGTGYPAESLQVRQALSIALLDAGRTSEGLQLAHDPAVADVLCIARLQVGDTLGAVIAALSARAGRGVRFQRLLDRMYPLAPAQRPTFLGQVAAGFLGLHGKDHAVALRAWRSAMKRLDVPQKASSPVQPLQKRPWWMVGSYQDRDTLLAFQDPGEEDPTVYLDLAEHTLNAGRTDQARQDWAAAWAVYDAREEEGGLEPFLLGWAKLGDWQQVRRIAKRMRAPGDALETAVGLAFIRGEPEQLPALVPHWLSSDATGCTPDETGFDSLAAALEGAEFAGHLALVDAAIARISAPVLANRALLAGVENCTTDDDFPRALKLLKRLDPKCPEDRSDRHAAWQSTLDTMLTADRARLALKVVDAMLTRAVPIEDWHALVSSMHTAGLASALAERVLAARQTNMQERWLDAVLLESPEHMYAVRAHIARLKPSAEDAQRISEALKAIPEAEAPLNDATAEERLDWLLEQTERAVTYSLPASQWLAKTHAMLSAQPDADPDAWSTWAELSVKASAPCLNARCPAPSVFAAIEAIVPAETRVAVLEQLNETLFSQDRLESLFASGAALLRTLPAARCNVYVSVDQLSESVAYIDPAAAWRLVDKSPADLRTAARRRLVDLELQANRLDQAWAWLQQLPPETTPLPCALNPRPDRAELLRRLVAEAMEWGRFDLVRAASSLAGPVAHRSSWMPLWTAVASALIDAGQIPRLIEMMNAHSGAPATVLESELVRHWLADGQLRRAVEYARAPATRMRVLLAIARARYQEYRVIWQSLLLP